MALAARKAPQLEFMTSLDGFLGLQPEDSCSPEQAEAVRAAGFRFVTLLLDGDDAGRKVPPEILATLARQVYVRQVELPDGLKPDTMPESWFERLV